jgi:hypothetical protein
MKSQLRFPLLQLSLTSLFLLSLFSCSKPVNVNESFEKRYGKEVASIRSERAVSEEIKKEVTKVPLPTKEEVGLDAGFIKNIYPYAKIVKFGDKPGSKTSVSNESYEQSAVPIKPNSNGVFDISYNTAEHLPFRRAGVEFDDIEVPDYDVYGVPTKMSDKSYLFPGNASLEKNINHISSAQNPEDIENSETIIKEQRLLKRKQKMIKIFGSDFVELASLEKSEEKKSTTTNPKQTSDQKTQNNIAPAVTTSNTIKN